MIFFHDRDHASDTDAMVRLVRDGNFIFKYRILYVIICNMNTDPVIFFVNFQRNIAFHGRRKFLAGMDRIFQGVRKQAAQIRNLKRVKSAAVTESCRSIPASFACSA